MVVAMSGRSALRGGSSEPVYLDVDVVDGTSGTAGWLRRPGEPSLFATDPPAPDESGARGFVSAEPSAESAISEETAFDPIAEPVDQDDPRDGLDEYEYIDDTSGLETEAIAEAMGARG